MQPFLFVHDLLPGYNINMKKFLIILAALFLFVPNSYAVVRISNMNDFAFGTWSGTGQLQSSDAVCIHDTQGNMNYGIRPRGSGTSFAFTVTNGTVTIPYSVEFQGSVGGMTTLTTNVKTVFNNANRTSSTCGGGTNATLRVTFTQANLEAAEAGSYTGVLTIILTRN